ncbi:3D domain-containing protein [Bdellovibrio sp. HCB337]|uniref:3D domain-containing protein n=1 Tax=Bdellovibrio sp. HCB337 TaxID=3394358 RepID=UPI0039A5513F
MPLIVPTIYYKPIIYKEKEVCASSEMVNLIDENDKVLIALCKSDYDNCLMQGSCFVVEGETTRNFNFTKTKDGIHRFAERKEDRCPYGYGIQALCLDPFYSVAADLNYHNVGDVIYVPRLVGVKLPDGSKHSGYLIIRDIGGAIIGENRFDFFTGFFGPFDDGNVFAALGFGDKKHRFGYQKMDAEVAKLFRESRNYPNIP